MLLFGSKTNKIIPKKIILSCINAYEKKDIFLNIDNEYLIKKNKLLSKRIINIDDFTDFIESTRGIVYSNFSYNKYPTNSLNFERIFLSDIKFNKLLYISIKAFFIGIYEKLVKILEDNSLEYLILDLRDSFGGNIDEFAKIANLLLPKCKIASLKYKSNERTLYSDEKSFKYKKIFICVNECTSSCSEILALSLRKKLKNVFVIGNKTRGKCVGQITYTNKKYSYIFNITAFKWYVEGESADKLQEYLNTDNFNNILFRKNDDYLSQILNNIDL